MITAAVSSSDFSFKILFSFFNHFMIIPRIYEWKQNDINPELICAASDDIYKHKNGRKVPAIRLNHKNNNPVCPTNVQQILYIIKDNLLFFVTVSWKCHPVLQDTDGTCFILIFQGRCIPNPVSLLWGYRHSLFKLVFPANCIPNHPTLISGYLDFLFQLVSENILMPESASTKALPRNWHEMSSSNLCSGFLRNSLS